MDSHGFPWFPGLPPFSMVSISEIPIVLVASHLRSPQVRPGWCPRSQGAAATYHPGPPTACVGGVIHQNLGKK